MTHTSKDIKCGFVGTLTMALSNTTRELIIVLASPTLQPFDKFRNTFPTGAQGAVIKLGSGETKQGV